MEPKLPTEAVSQSEKENILKSYREYMAGTDRLTEQNVIAATLRLMQQLPEQYWPENIFPYINKNYKGNFDAFAKACMPPLNTATSGATCWSMAANSMHRKESM